MSDSAGASLNDAMQHPAMSQLLARLIARSPVEADADDSTRLAAVAAVLRVTDEPELLFIKRADAEGDPWSGHMAFPGGRHEPQDRSLLETAVRETREETAIDLRTHGRILGVLDDLAPRTPTLPRINIRPYVAIVQPDVQIVASHEVATHFWIPVRSLVAPEMQTEHEVELHGSRLRFPGYRVGPHIAWGLTERILRQLLSLLN